MKIYVASTDRDWYSFLGSRGAEEVNFWRPSDTRAFRAIDRDELFFFRLGSPWSKIAGFGIFTAAHIQRYIRLAQALEKAGIPTERRFQVVDPDIAETLLGAP